MNFVFDNSYKCKCAIQEINNTRKVNQYTIMNDTNNQICVSQINKLGEINKPIVCMDPKSGVNLDRKLYLNENIKIITPATNFYKCSGIIKVVENSNIKVSDIERNRWNTIC